MTPLALSLAWLIGFKSFESNFERGGDADSFEILLASNLEFSSDVDSTGLDLGVALALVPGAGAAAASFMVPLYGEGRVVGFVEDGRGVMPK